MIEILHSAANGKVDFTASENGNLLGICSCRLDEDIFVIEELSCGADPADGLVRAALNFALQGGTDKALSELSENQNEMLRRLGFPLNGCRIDSIVEFFAPGKHCGGYGAKNAGKNDI